MTPLSRRTLLRGAAGIGLALPWLEAMVGNRAQAQQLASPLRYLLGFAGVSLGGYDGDINQTFVPTTVGANYDLKAALTNLAPVKDQVTIVSGLRIPTAAENGGTTPAAGRPVAFHGNQLAPLLTGKRTGGGFSAPTSEHLAAAVIGGNTPFKPLVVRVQASYYVGTAAPGTGDDISWRPTTNGVQAVPPRYSPQQLFQALFGNFNATGLTADQVAEQRWLQESRRSVLDSVNARAQKLRTRLGTADRLRLDAHFQEVRDLEQRVASVAPPMVGLCQKPLDPGADPQVGGGQNTSAEGNITYTQNLGYSGEDTRAQVMVDLVAMAFICDLTRSTLFQFTNSQSFLNMFQVTGQKSDLHELSHGSHGNQSEDDTTQALAKGINWHMKHWATLLGRLRDAREGDRSVLDNTAAVFTFEGGHGFDPADNRTISAHSTENMAMLVAGGAGGLKRGLHLKAPGAHPAQVLLTALKALGSTQTTFGEVSGEIAGLR